MKIDNYHYFLKTDLPLIENCEEFITYNDLDKIQDLDKFLLNVVKVDLSDPHPDNDIMYPQILVGICRFLDDNPKKYEQIFNY